MLTSKLGRSVFAMVAIRSCGDAFVPTAPMRSLPSTSTTVGSRSHYKTGGRATHAATGPRSSALDLTSTRHGPLHPKSESDLPVLPDEKMPLRRASSRAPRSATKPLVVCGPSGVGKGTIISKFMEREHSPTFGFSVSHTTREPREGEVDGVHYHFVSRRYMLDKIREGSFFVEHAEVHGNLYGTSFESLFDVSNGNNETRQCLLDIDVEGARSIKEFQSRQRREREVQQREEDPTAAASSTSTTTYSSQLPELDARFVFIAPPSVDVLRDRLAGRGTETPETLERRFQNARAEMEYGTGEGNFDAVVVNDDLEEACEEFERVVEGMYA